MYPARTKSTRAFTRTELLVSIACLVLILAAILPALAKPKALSSRINCSYCMKNIGLAFRVWATDNNDLLPMQMPTNDGGTKELIPSGAVFPHFLAMSNELSTPKILRCPKDKNRSEATEFTSDFADKNISYFLNLDAEENPSDMLAGDRNLTNRPPAGSVLIPIIKNSILGWTEEIHFGKGNLVFGDGHVAQFANGSTGTVVNIPTGVTNRLAVP